ncbi:MAG: hypothetical protein PHW97_10750, partial [Fermentimonas sp.]|nr:hypothetical protein [Fermentimonas sp.]
AGKSTNAYRSDINESILPSQIIGRARSGIITPDPEPDPIPTHEPEPTPEPEPDPTPDPTPDPDVDELPVVENHPSIRIYSDKFNRVCVLNIGRLYPGATVTASVKSLNYTYTQNLTGFHTAINYSVPSGLTVDVFVKNGDRMSRTQLTF